MVRLNLSSDDVRNCKKTDPRFGGYTRIFEKSEEQRAWQVYIR